MKEKLDNLIESLSDYILELTKSGGNRADEVAKCTSALAELISTRAYRV